jgi:hypothetical protein
LDELLAEADELAAIVKDLFMRDHRGVLGPLKRVLQKDVGVHFIHGEVVGTIHVGLLNTGITSRTLFGRSWDDLSEYLHDTSVGFGTDASGRCPANQNHARCGRHSTPASKETSP